MRKISHIIRVDRQSVSDIVPLVPDSNVYDMTKWNFIDIKTPASLTLSDKIEDKVRMYTAKLVFRTCENLKNLDKQVYRCFTSDRKYILLGSPVRPYPITTVTEVHPDNFTDSHLYEVTVNYTSSCIIG